MRYLDSRIIAIHVSHLSRKSTRFLGALWRVRYWFVVGMFAGLIADPIRGQFQTYIGIGRTKNAIQTDFLFLASYISCIESSSWSNEESGSLLTCPHLIITGSGIASCSTRASACGSSGNIA